MQHQPFCVQEESGVAAVPLSTLAGFLPPCNDHAGLAGHFLGTELDFLVIPLIGYEVVTFLPALHTPAGRV